MHAGGDWLDEFPVCIVIGQSVWRLADCHCITNTGNIIFETHKLMNKNSIVDRNKRLLLTFSFLLLKTSDYNFENAKYSKSRSRPMNRTSLDYDSYRQMILCQMTWFGSFLPPRHQWNPHTFCPFVFRGTLGLSIRATPESISGCTKICCMT